MNNSKVLKQLKTDIEKLAENITDIQFRENPNLEKKFGKTGRGRCLEDNRYHLNYLIEAVRIESTVLFNQYLEWVSVMLQQRNIPDADLVSNIEYIGCVISDQYPDSISKHVEKYLASGLNHLRSSKKHNQSFIDDNQPFADEARRYLSLLLDGKRAKAVSLIDDVYKNGASVSEIYEYIFQATQYEVGALWHRNEITIAHEHYCTAATQLIMSRFYPDIFSTEKNGLKLVACSVASELHELGIRMVSDFFELDGWDTYYMGANMPELHIIDQLKAYQADLIAISVTLPINAGRAETLIDEIRSDRELEGLKIITGGYAFLVVSDLWEKVGADGFAKNAREAIHLAHNLVK